MTLGLGDLFPVTIPGQVLSIVFFFKWAKKFQEIGVLALSIFTHFVKGKTPYQIKKNTNHIIVTGNPSLQQVKDFIIELFHEDHMALSKTIEGERNVGAKVLSG